MAELDPEKELVAREEFERKQAALHTAMDALVRSSGEKSLSLVHNGITIRIRMALPGSARSEILKLAQKYKGVDLEAARNGTIIPTELPDGFLNDSLEQLYRTLAVLCMDEPYNSAESWRYYDEITGEAELIYQKAEALIKEAHQTAISFRKES
jgi:hypothetical protein